MTVWWAVAAVAALLGVVLGRPHSWGPPAGAAVAVGIASAGGLVRSGDFAVAAEVLPRRGSPRW